MGLLTAELWQIFNEEDTRRRRRAGDYLFRDEFQDDGQWNYGSDTFDRADSSSSLGALDGGELSGTAWTIARGTWGITGNKAYSVTDDAGVAGDIAVITVPNTNLEIQVTVAGTIVGATPVRLPQICASYADSSNYILLGMYNGNLEMGKVQAGTGSTVASGAVTIADGVDHVLKLVRRGLTFDGYVDGIKRCSYTLSGAEIAAISVGTGYGIRLRKVGSPATAARFNDFSVKAIVPTPGRWTKTDTHSRIRAGNDALIYSGNEIIDQVRGYRKEGDGYGGGRGLGVWEATTNLCPNGNGTTNATLVGSTGSATVSRDTANGIYKFGATCLKAVTPNAIAGEGMHWLYPTSTRIPVTAGQSYTWSGWAWGASGTVRLRIDTYDGVEGSIVAGDFALSSVATLTPTPQKLKVTFTIPGSGVAAVSPRIVTDVQQGITFYCGGMLLENQPIDTPYVETDGATASRSAARVQMPVAGLFTESQGWLIFRLRAGWSVSAEPGVGSGSAALFYWQDDSNNRIRLFYSEGNDDFRLIRTSGGTSQTADTASQSFVKDDSITVIAAWTATQLKLSVAGGAFAEFASTTIPTLAATLADIGALAGGGNDLLDCDILFLACGSGTLSDADAAALHTALSTAGKQYPQTPAAVNAIATSAGCTAVKDFTMDTSPVYQAATPGSGKLVFGGGLVSTPGYTDPYIAELVAVTRRAGLALQFDWRSPVVSNKYSFMGFSKTAASPGGPGNSGWAEHIYWRDGALRAGPGTSMTSGDLISFAADTLYRIQIRLGRWDVANKQVSLTGSTYYIQGGAYGTIGGSTWAIFWRATTGSDDGIYPVFADYSQQIALDSVRVTRASLPMPKVYDSMVRADGAIGSAESGQAYTLEQGTAAVLSNEGWLDSDTDKDRFTFAAVADGIFTVAVKGDQSGANQRMADFIVRGKDSNNYLRVSLETTLVVLSKNESGTPTNLATAAATLSDDTYYTIAVLAIGNVIRVFVDGTLYVTHTLTGGDITNYGTATQAGIHLRKAGSPTVAARFKNLLVQGGLGS